MEPIRRPTEPLGMLTHRLPHPQSVPRIPSMLHTPHSLPMASSLHIPPWIASLNFWRHLESTYKKTGLSVRLIKGKKTWAFQGTTLGGKNKGSQLPAWLYGINRRYTILRILAPSPGGSKKCGVGTSIEKVCESLRIPSRAHWWSYFSPKLVSKDRRK